MLNIALICCQIDCKSEQFDSADIGMREENKFYNIIHAVCVCESVSNTPFSG